MILHMQTELQIYGIKVYIATHTRCELSYRTEVKNWVVFYTTLVICDFSSQLNLTINELILLAWSLRNSLPHSNKQSAHYIELLAHAHVELSRHVIAKLCVRVDAT